MQIGTLTRVFRRSLLAPAIILASAALPAAAILPALSVPAHASPAQAAMQRITIHAAHPNFPKKIAAGIVSVTLVSDATEDIQVGFARAKAGATKAQIKTAYANSQTSAGFAHITKVMTFIGGDDSIGVGGTETVILDMRTPGLYGADLTVGSNTPSLLIFTVAQGSAPGTAMPSGGIPVTLEDMKFVGLPKQVAAGSVSFQVTNKGPQLHEMALLVLDPGKTQRDVLNYLHSPQGRNGPPSWAHARGGMLSISAHQTANLQLKLKPGYYIAVCPIPDPKMQGELHMMEGMIAHFVVQ